MKKITEKKERALGTKLFLKAERCNSPKCAMVRKPHKPGVHGKRSKPLSEYGRQLHEKQKAQIIYGLSGKQMENLFTNLSKEKILARLEKRLDRVVFLLGLAKSPRIARQLVSHGHVLVNKKKTKTPSFQVSIGDKIEIRPESKKSKLFEDLNEQFKRINIPDWLEVDKASHVGLVQKEPVTDVYAIPFNIDAVSEFYSR